MDTAHQQLVMLAHLLAVLLGFSSFTFYIAAFFYPEVHRRSDLLWSGLGMVYAAVLWFGAGQMTGTVLLGQVTAVALLLGLGWQTLTVRREKTPVYQQTPIVLTPEVVGSWAKNKINQLRIAPDDTVRPLPPQNRSLTATAAERFRPDIDPRRRPVYDYEFVEDGELLDGELLEDEQPLEENILAQNGLMQPVETAKVVDFQNLTEDESEEDVPEEPGIVPPSAAAEILSEVSLSDTDREANAILEDVDTEPLGSGETTPIDERGHANSTEIDTEAEIAVKTQPVNITVDEWDFGLDDNETNEAQTQSKTPEQDNRARTQSGPASKNNNTLPVRKKPSLLATPIILLGWVKDVIGSMTQPKASKPVIEIPRRDSQPPADQPPQTEPDPTQPIEPMASDPLESEPLESEPPFSMASAAPSSNESFSEPLAATPEPERETALDNSGNFDDDNDWEDSNWAD